MINQQCNRPGSTKLSLICVGFYLVHLQVVTKFQVILSECLSKITEKENYEIKICRINQSILNVILYLFLQC